VVFTLDLRGFPRYKSWCLYLCFWWFIIAALWLLLLIDSCKLGKIISAAFSGILFVIVFPITYSYQIIKNQNVDVLFKLQTMHDKKFHQSKNQRSRHKFFYEFVRLSTSYRIW